MRCLISIVVVVVMGSGAAAEGLTIDEAFPPSLGFSSPSHATAITRVEVAVRSAPDVTWVTIELAGRRRERVGVPIDVPAGTRVVGMGVRRAERTAWAEVQPLWAAKREVAAAGDPALLEWASTTAGQDHLTLYVQAPATIELAIELPALATLGIVPETSIGRLDVTVDGAPRGSWQRLRERVAIAVGDVAVDPQPRSYPHVDGRRSLVADSAVPILIELSSCCTSRTQWSVDKRTIQRMVKDRRVRLRRCYMQVAQRDPRLEGRAMLQFVIGDDGRVRSSSVESELPAEITECLAAEVASWEFPASDDGAGIVMVNYPLELRLAR